MRKAYLLILTTLAFLLAACGPKEDPIDPTPTNVEVSGVNLSQPTLALEAGKTGTLTATVQPSNATNKTVTWSSSNTSVATVSNGTVSAVAEGTTTITATAGGKSATCQVTVSKKVVQVTSVTLNKTEAELIEEEELTLEAKVEPNEATDKDITWASSDETVVKVEDGKILAVAFGNATVTATAGGKSATCQVTVKEPEYKAKERAALIKLFNANNGNNWSEYNKRNWCSDKPLELWSNIDMTPDGKHVKSLWISDENLKGQIPEEIADLTELEVLKLVGLYNTPSEGHPIPSVIGNLNKLKNLTLWTYTVSGTIPNSIFKIQSLEELVLGHIPLSSWTIPSDISNLKNLKELSLPGCNLTGSIPDEIGQLSRLEKLDLSVNKLSGSLPASMGSLINLKEIDLASNSLSGSIPTAVANMDNYWMLWPNMFYSNLFTMDNLRDSKIPIPRSPKITSLSGKELDLETEFKKNKYTVLFNLNPRSGDAIECLSQLVAIYNKNKNNGLGIITSIDNNYSREFVYDDLVSYDNSFKDVLKKCGATWDSFIRYMYDDYPDGAPLYAEKGNWMYAFRAENSLVILGPDQTVVYSTLLDKSRDYLNNAVAYLQDVFKTTITHYESKSSTLDGKVTKYQAASTGKGIDLVITGDAFSDREMVSGGTFEKAAKQAVADLFSVEPYKSMKDRFNVYFVKAVSKHEEYFNGCSTVFGGGFGYGSAVGGDDDKVLEYAKKAVTNNSRMDNVTVLVLMNSIRQGGTTYMMDPSDQSIYAGGSSTIWIPYKDVTVTSGVSNLANTVVHEVGGHGLGKLADEYAYYHRGAVDQAEVNYINKVQKWNWYQNISLTPDQAQAPWSQFIGDSDFASENIGVYEGGDTFWSGVWRPTEQSVMNDSYKYSTFNAPSRSQIYTRIMKLSEGESWKYDYNAFKTWDKAHPTKVTTRSIVEVDDDEVPVHVPPVRVGKTWKDVIEGR